MKFCALSVYEMMNAVHSLTVAREQLYVMPYTNGRGGLLYTGAHQSLLSKRRGLYQNGTYGTQWLGAKVKNDSQI
ncbi:MAG: hypothetical protein JXQ96_13900 [Cyclobacteriaceae bacterium]